MSTDSDPYAHLDPLVAEYYRQREPYTTLLDASHASLPHWRDPEAKLNRKPADEPRPFKTDPDGATSLFGEEEERIREEMKVLRERFRELEVKKSEKNAGKVWPATELDEKK